MSRVQSIERAFAVLGALADGPIGVTEVADRADLPKSTAARMLASLAREGQRVEPGGQGDGEVALIPGGCKALVGILDRRAQRAVAVRRHANAVARQGVHEVGRIVDDVRVRAHDIVNSLSRKRLTTS